jgi:hypothetical protein
MTSAGVTEAAAIVPEIRKKEKKKTKQRSQ